ncbi:uncharacterized protein [Apostichopus japonicus]|uniref:uncharacterized protein n=1 Tax=Stichopus japonicus TaxID=307972 RepID=UPI003AB571D0
MTQDLEKKEESQTINDSDTDLFENTEVMETMSLASSSWATPQTEHREVSNSERRQSKPSHEISSQKDIVGDNKFRPSLRPKRKSVSQPEAVKRPERSRSSLRFPAEDPKDSVKMSQFFLEDEPWHSCKAKGCPEFFSEYHVLKEHLLNAHPKLKPSKYPCAMKSCKNTCKSPQEWILHMADEHPEFVSKKEIEFFDRVIHPTIPGHTWFRFNNSQSSRLDRIYSSRDFFVNKATTSPIPYSDHKPIQVNIKIPHTATRGKGYWKYNVSLNNDKEFCKELRVYYKLWSTLKPGFNALSDWWENVKSRIKTLAVRHSSRIARQKRNRLKELQTLCATSNSQEVDDIINTDLRGAYIRSRAKFLEEGEKPSAFFFRKEKRQADQKVVHQVRKPDGNITCNIKEIIEVFHKFFSDLYSNHEGFDESSQDVFINSLHNMLNDEDIESLEKPITLDEIKIALSLASNNKSPGIDGLPYEFYSSFLDMLGEDLLGVYNNIFKTGTMSMSQRTGIVTLLPKKAAGASVNMSKTCGLKLGTFASRQLPTNIHWSTSSIKITGVTFGSKEAVHCNWATKVNSATLLAKSWSSRHLTLLGKVLVTNTVIYPLFYFVGPVFRVPDSVVKEVNKAVFSFIWGENKPDLVSRKVIILDRLQGGLGLDSFRNKMDALLIRPLFTLLTRMQDPPIHFIIARFFLAMPLRRVFPQLWSNTRPNSAVCPPSLLYASDIIRRLHSMDSLFFQSSKSIKLITKSLQPSGANLIAVRDYPTFPWETIWKLAFSNMLGNKLMDFQWRLAHHILYTGKRIKDWGMGDGICPCEQCNEIETISHIFW